MEASFFKEDIKASDKALELIQQFNGAGIVDSIVQMNAPEVWAFSPEVVQAGQARRFSKNLLLVTGENSILTRGGLTTKYHGQELCRHYLIFRTTLLEDNLSSVICKVAFTGMELYLPTR